MIISDTFSSIASTPYMQVICKFTYTFLLPIEKTLILIKEDITTVARWASCNHLILHADKTKAILLDIVRFINNIHERDNIELLFLKQHSDRIFKSSY